MNTQAWFEAAISLIAAAALIYLAAIAAGAIVQVFRIAKKLIMEALK